MSIRGYPDYKGSNLPYIDSVPSHWILKKIAWDIPYSVGWTPPSGNEDYYDGDIPWVTIGDLERQSIKSTKSTITELAVDVRKAKPVPPGSLLFSFKLSVGKVTFTAIECFTNEAIAAFEPNKTVILSYWYYASPLIIPHYGRDNIYGAKLLNQDLIGSVKFYCPPKTEQQKIAQFLDYETAKIDALIDEQKRLIELLKEKRQAVISHAVTKGLNPDAQMKDSGVEWLGEVPEHWRVAPLKWFSTIRGGIAMGKRYDSDEKLVDCPYLRVANVQSGHFNFSEIKTVKVTHSEAIKYRLKFGEVLMNEGGDNDKLGRGAIWRDDIPNCLHQNHVFAINIETGLLPEWLATFTESSSARAYFYLYSKQSTNLASISSSNVVSCLLPIPPKDEQKSILSKLAQEVDAIDNLNNESIKMMEMLKERRSALISAAVTGKIDVRDWQPPTGSDTVDSNASVQTERQYG